MNYWDYYRDIDPEDIDYAEEREAYEQEPMDLPPCCPYRQFLMNRQSPTQFNQPGRPPYGPPQGPPMGPSYGPPQGPPSGQPGGHKNTPPGPPPQVTPMKEQAQFKAGPGVMMVEPGTLRPCLFRYVYIWPRRGRGFWAWLTFIGRRSVSGFRWNGFRWVYFGMDLRQIESFTCY